jgi:riboflavin kinase/FMN adenylyltransferase
MVVTHGTIRPGNGPHALTIGNFDGVHLGHRSMLERVAAKGLEIGAASCVLTFEPHPREFFSPQTAPPRLTRLRDKVALLGAAGLQRVHVARFDASLAALGAERFVDEVLVRGLQTRWLLVGRDFRFGAKRAGDFALLEEVAQRRGFAVEAMPDVLHDGERVSSSAVRAALAAGDLGRAARLLGRGYSIRGRVAHGRRLGRSIGFPTVNIPLRRQPPLSGILVVECAGADRAAPGRWVPGVASIGRRPTVEENGAPILEVHLLEPVGELYGSRLEVRFLRKLREEEKYAGIDLLRAAIARDVALAKEHFSPSAHG